jgi:hypothetical protein
VSSLIKITWDVSGVEVIITNLVPFVFGDADVLAELPDHFGDQVINKIPIGASLIELTSVGDHHITQLSPARFARLLNVANGVAYGGGMGMPEWVMLDCALLPSFFAGFMGPASLLSSFDCALINTTLERVEAERSEERCEVEQRLKVPQGSLAEEEWFPISEFCALPRVTPHQIMGYSLYSLKRGLGVRAKAFGLWVWQSIGYEYQVGVAQWSNLTAVRAHLRFGPLEILDPLTSMHTKAGETFIYRLSIPPSQTLVSLIDHHNRSSQTHHTRPTPLEGTWRLINDLSWWLSHRETSSSKLFLYDVRKSQLGLEALVVFS